MPAGREPRTTLRRGVAAATALPLLSGALAACGHGSEARMDDTGVKAVPVAAGARKLSADTVRIGYFAN